MLKNMKLSVKMALGFGVLIILSAFMGFIGWRSLNKIDSMVNLADSTNRLVKLSLDGRVREKNFIIRKEHSYIDEGKSLVENMGSEIDTMMDLLDDKETESKIISVRKSANDWSNALSEYADLEDKKTDALDIMVNNARNAITEIEKMCSDQDSKLFNEIAGGASASKIKDRLDKAYDSKKLNNMILECRRDEKNFIIRNDQTYKEQVDTITNDIISLCEDLKIRFSDDANDRQADAVIGAVKTYTESFDRYVEYVDLQKGQEEIMVTSARTLQEEASDARAIQKTEMKSSMTATTTFMLLLAIISTVAGSLLAYVITRGIVGPINRVIDGMKAGSEQVATASAQVSSASQQMAEGASEQASSLEEVSSSLEEMTSMTKQNADNAREANTKSTDAKEAATKGTDAMSKMSDAIGKIKVSADETAKIIKTIDEIAFQTNLLALNAAVEAARAGEAGMGFAVVAEEVRNLAQRSAEAAKDTSELIAESQINADNGVKVSEEVGVILSEISHTVDTVTGLIAEVTAASVEQSEGINQVNIAISQVDQVTQSSASNAEESASASEELSSQAEELKDMVGMLVSIVNGSDTNTVSSTPVKKIAKPKSQVRSLSAGKNKKEPEKVLQTVVDAEDVIPLDDEFEDF